MLIFHRQHGLCHSLPRPVNTVEGAVDRLANLEENARKAKRGLWADETPLGPWEFRARQKTPEVAPEESKDPKMSFWLNSSSGVRHNQRCEHYQKTKKGRFCGADEGKPCGICGG